MVGLGKGCCVDGIVVDGALEGGHNPVGLAVFLELFIDFVVGFLNQHNKPSAFLGNVQSVR